MPTRANAPRAGDAGAAAAGDREAPRRVRGRRAVVRRPAAGVAARRRVDGSRSGAGVRVRRALRAALPVDPDRRGLDRAGVGAAERGGRAHGSRLRPGDADRAADPGPPRAAVPARRRRHRSRARQAALLQPQDEPPGGLHLRAGLRRREPADLPARGHPGVPRRERDGRRPGQEPAGVRGRRARRPVAAGRPIRAARWRSRRRSRARSTRSRRARTTSSTTSPTRSASRGRTPPSPAGCSSSSGCRACCWPRSSPPTPAASSRPRSAASRRTCVSAAPIAAICGGCSLYRTLAFAGAGSVLGVGLGLLSATAVLGPDALLSAAAADLAASALTAAAIGMLTTALALYVPGRRALRREISQERAELARRARRRAGACSPTPPCWRPRPSWPCLRGVLRRSTRRARQSRQASRSRCPRTCCSRRSIAWFVGVAVAVRGALALASRLRLPGSPAFRLAGLRHARPQHRRRSRSLGTGIAGVGLVVAFGMALAMFTGTYDGAKAADARFVVGSDLRVVPSVLSPRPHPPSYASKLEVAGIEAVTPVVSKLDNAVLIGPNDQDRATLTAIDPAGFARVAALSDAFFAGGSASKAMAALDERPPAVARQRRCGRRAVDRAGRGRQGAPRARHEAPEARDAPRGRAVRALPGVPGGHRSRREPRRLRGRDAHERGRLLSRPSR